MVMVSGTMSKNFKALDENCADGISDAKQKKHIVFFK